MRMRKHGWEHTICSLQKPVIYAANVAEDDLANDGADNAHVQAVRKYAAEQNSEIFVICAQIEEEISELDEDEKKNVPGGSWTQGIRT